MLKVLFVSSGNSKKETSSIEVTQGESLKDQNIDVGYYSILGKGLIGYMKNVRPLRKYLYDMDYDIIHAHYGLAAIVALLAKKKQKIVVSFMGDDIIGSNRADGSITKASTFLALVNTFLARTYYDFSIVKSKEMIERIKIKKNISLIPNGVNLSIFIPKKKQNARKQLNINTTNRLIIFVANPERTEKNILLVKDALKIIDDPEIQLITVYNMKHEELVNYYNAADLLVLTSFHEGSPNVIKEAMACNCPIVATDVGDITWVIGKTEGCYIASFKANEFSEKINLALEFSKNKDRTNGRQRIIELGLDSVSIAKKIKDVYNLVLS